MEEALYSKYGFFNNKKVRSKKSGDFLTSPEVSKYFGKILNQWIQKNNLDLNIVEFGSGTGSLIEQINTENKIAVINNVNFFICKNCISMMMKGARVNAWLNNRTSVIPEDIHAVFHETIAHRLVFNPVYELRRTEISRELSNEILNKVAAP